jgi:hypothetical protein
MNIQEKRSRGEISDYIKSLANGTTRYVTRTIERKVFVEKVYMLHHNSGMRVVLPPPEAMRELQAMGDTSVQTVAVGSTIRREMLLKKSANQSRFITK